MAQCDAAGVNGSNRILFHGAPRLRMMPNGCLGSPVLVLLFGLDRGFLMDVGPEQVPRMPLVTWVELTEARNMLAVGTRGTSVTARALAHCTRVNRGIGTPLNATVGGGYASSVEHVVRALVRSPG